MKLFGLCGSARTQSLNHQLLELAASAVRDLGAGIELAPQKALLLPVYDGDAETPESRPPGVEALRAAILAADGLVIASPEYNSSIPGGLKNAIDWISRPPAPQAFRRKQVLLLGATPGNWGTVRTQQHLRAVLSVLGASVLPGMFPLAHADNAFAADGSLRDPQLATQLRSLVTDFLAECRLHAAAR